MKIGLVGPSYQERSLPFDAQRTVNLYPVIDETQQGKEVAALYGTPGLSTFATTVNGAFPIRGLFSSSNGRCFVIASNSIQEINSNGTVTNRATMGALVSGQSVTGPVTIDENPTQMAICDGTNLWIYTYATDTVVQNTSSGMPSAGAGTVCFMDGYFIFNENSSGRFFITSINDGTQVDPLDFATAESSPDNLVRVISASGYLWMIGERSIELWANNGGVDFPFSRVGNTVIDAGCIAAHSVCLLDNTVFWISKDTRGSLVVYRANGPTPQRISTHAIEEALGTVPDPTVLTAYSYQQDGHLFYVITAGNMTASLVYDVSTQMWHERSYLDAQGQEEAHLSYCHAFAFNKHFVGDRQSNNIYLLSGDNYSDAGSPIKRMRSFTHICEEGQRIKFSELVVDFEYGVGLSTGQGSDPVAYLEISRDGGRTWSNQYESKIGMIGNTRARARWSRLGQGRMWTFRVTVSDPVKIAICGAYLK